MADKTEQDNYWNAWPAGRIHVALAISLANKELSASDSVINSAIPTPLAKVGDKLIGRLRKFGDGLLADGFNNIADVSRYLHQAKTLNPPGKFGSLAAALVSIADQPDQKATSALLTSLIFRFRSSLPTATVAAAPKRASTRAAGANGATATQSNGEKPRPKGIADALQLRALVKLIAQSTNIADDDMRDVRQAFIGKGKLKAPAQLNFLCYRFHSNPKLVVRSFMAIEPSNALIPATFFVNVSSEVGAREPRISRGIVFPGGERLLYFIGTIEDNNAFKILVLDRPPAPKDFYVGMVLSIESDGTAIAGRVLLKATDKSNDKDAKIGPPMTVEAARKELGDADLDKIRNRIQFKLEESNPVFKGSVKLSEDDLVREVHQALMRSKKPIFRYKTARGRPFNPAKDEFYTFNSALTIWKHKE